MRLLIILLFSASFSFAQQANKYPALLWKISGNGLKKPSYLYGTMHVSNRVAWHLTDEFFSALKSVQVVGLETHPGEWLNNMEATGELAELSRPRNNSYSQDFYGNTFTAVYPEKKILKAILSYDPDIINGLLYRQNKSKENFEENTYVDLFIYQSASKLNKQIISLENFSTAEIQSRLAAVPDEEAEENSRRGFYGINQKIEDAYRVGDLNLLDSLSKLSTSQNTQKYLINERNVSFAETIDSVLKLKTLFSGVGAAHLPGDAGVIELLRKKGYAVEPVIGATSKKSNATKEELDQQMLPLTSNKRLTPDSLLSLELPGKLYPIFESAQLKYYIHPDMINGNFYTIVRLSHIGAAAGWGPVEMQKRLDSLLFENIPGKILKKENIVSGNQTGIELLCRTTRGDEQRYRFFFTESEMVMIKLGGKGSYAGTKEADKFFNSIHFENIEKTNLLFSPPSGGYSVKISGSTNFYAGASSSGIGLTEEFSNYNKSTKQLFGIDHAVYNDFNYLEEDTFELSRFTINALRAYKYKLSGQFSFLKIDGLPAVRFTGKNEKGGRMDGKIIIKGVHYYFVYQICEPGLTPDFSSFDSFTLTDFKHLHAIKEIKDKDFLFKTEDEVTNDAASLFSEKYAEAYKLAFSKKEKKANTEDEFRSGSKLYYSPSNNEYVSITFERYSSYDYRNRKALEEKIDHLFSNGTGLLSTHQEKSFENGMLRYNCILKDTATSRAIKVQLYFKNSTMHEISVPYDTIVGIQGWAKSFLENFQPLDSAAGPDLFTNKFSKLTADLSSTDTSARNKANLALESIGIPEDLSGEFITFVGSDKFALVNEDSRAQLLVSGGTLKTNKIIEPYRKLYTQYTDSFFLQLCVLKGLTFLKNQEGFNAFKELLMIGAPLVGDESSVADVFAILHDSLPLCKNFFPAMLSLTKFDEYKAPVYTLLSELIANHLVTVAQLKPVANDILMDATLALKRYSPTSKQKASKESMYSQTEKVSAEMSELIRENLESMAASQNSSIAENAKAVAFERTLLVNSAIALIPFYKTEANAKQFLDKILKLKDQKLVLPVVIHFLKQGINPGDSLLTMYSMNEFTRTYFYSELEKDNITNWFDKKYLSQQSLITSLLQSQKQISSHYSDSEKSKKDSLILVKELPAHNKYQNGIMYVYRSPKNKSEESLWCIAFVPKTKSSITAKIEIISEAYYPEVQKTEQENLDLLLDAFSLRYRKRTSQGLNYND